MNIDLTQTEYNTLLNMMKIAHWVLFTYSVEEEPDKNAFKELDQKILSYGNSSQRENELNEEVETFIDEFETENFFNQLATQLTTRDLVNQIGLRKLREMAPEERFEKFEALQRRYLDEFEQNGIENVQIK